MSDGYGVAIPKSGIVMGAVFENVEVPVHGGVELGRLGWLLRLGAAVPASATPPAIMSKQRIRRNRGGLNVSFRFVIIESSVCIAFATSLAKSVANRQQPILQSYHSLKSPVVLVRFDHVASVIVDAGVFRF
jgi:hypothetical protein